MSRFRRVLQDWTFAAAGLLGAAGLRRLLLRRCVPPRHETVALAGLRAGVEVRIDRWGVPHIYGETPADLFFAQGYCQARDRFWQMELNRRMARGELAELFGPRLLRVDRFLRRQGFRRIAEQEIATVSDEIRSISDAYAAGVNAYLDRHPLPIEFKLLRIRPQPWLPIDSLIFARFMGWTMTFNWETELIRGRLIAQLGPDRAAALEPGTPAAAVPAGAGPALRTPLMAAQEFQPIAELVGGASNNWVVSGDRSTTGRPLLANDPHFRPRMPTIWHVSHLHGAGYDVIGATLPGLLGVLIGHNARIAWGVTAGLVDGQDLYLERCDPAQPRRFAFGSDWYDAQIIREEIRIRGKEAPVIDEVVLSRHGPLLNGTVGVPSNAPPLAQRTVNDECPSPTEAMLRINRAPDWPTFREALSLWTFPVLNFVYADVDGTIAYKLAGRIPIRARGDGFVPAPGWTGEHEWRGHVPFDELPEAVNPPDGVFASANSRPAAPCKHFLARDWADDSRWQRIMGMLRARSRVSIEDCQRMQVDVVSVPAQEVARRLKGLRLQDALAVRALTYLAGWDGKLDVDSVAATIYEVFRRELVRRVGRDLPPPFLDYLFGQGLDEALAAVSALHHRASSHLIGYLDTVVTPEMLAESFQAAVAWLRDELGPDPARWQWGRLHTITFMHPIGQAAPLLDRLLGLSRGPFPIGGDADTIAQAGVDPWHPFTASTFTVSYRQLFDVGDWDRGQFILPSGQSGHPGSPHYADMLDAWRRGEYCPMVFTPEAVERDTAETINLNPG